MLKLEDLSLEGLKIYQDDKLYRFTSDSVLLSRFVKVKKGDVVADFCSGSGIVGLHLYGLNKVIKSVTLFEMQKPLADMSYLSVKENGLTDIFKVVNCKLQDIGSEYNEKFSLIVCNPPYEQPSSGEKKKRSEIAVCRSEETLTLKELVLAVKKALKFGGRFNIVHRADRLAEVVFELKNNGLEPKRLQLISGGDKAPYLMLLEAVKGGKSGIKIEKNIRN